MLAPAAQSQRVRCRQIAQDDLGALAGFLAHGFHRTDHDDWTGGLARMAALPQVEGMPRFGYVLESDGLLVGALLLISSRRKSRIIASLCGWYVEPAWRSHSALLVAMATRQKHVTYLNVSPAPHVWRTLQAQGFRPYNFGRSAAFPALRLASLLGGGGAVTTSLPDDLPELGLLQAHDALGCLSLVCDRDGAVSPFVFKPRRLKRPNVTMMELIYCRSTDDFAHCSAALGRYLLKQGALGVILDGKIAGMPAQYAIGKEPRYFKGPEAPRNDLAFSEKVIFP